MSPELKLELDERLARAAFPWWEFESTDIVTHSMEYDPGYHYSSYSFESASMRLVVEVRRADYDESVPWDMFGEGAEAWRKNAEKRSYDSFSNEAAADIWLAVMA